jgi:hypothetical protein
VRAAPNRAIVPDRRVSPWGGGGETATAEVGNAMRTVAAQSPMWMRGVEGGAVEERARHSSVDEGDGAKKGNDGGRRLLWRPGGTGGEKKGRGAVAGVPRGAVRPWGLAPTVRWHPDRVPVYRDPAVACADDALRSSRGGGHRVAGAWGLAGSGRERRVGARARGPSREKKRSGPSLDEW